MKIKMTFSQAQRLYCARTLTQILQGYNPDIPAIAAIDREMVIHLFNVAACEMAMMDWKLISKKEEKISLLQSQLIALYLVTNNKKILDTLTESELFTAREINYKLFLQIINFHL